MGVLTYCIHRTDDGTEIVAPIKDAREHMRAAALDAFRAIPLRHKVTNKQLERAVVKSVDAALNDGLAKLHHASVRV